MKRTLCRISRLAVLCAVMLVCAGFVAVAGERTVYAATVSSKALPEAEKTKLTLYTGDKATALKLKNADNAEKITWKSSDKKIAKVSSKGKVTPVAEGKATITATVTINGKKYTCKTTVTVKKPYIAVTTKLPKELLVGEELELTVKAYGFKLGKLSWKSSKKSVLSVSSSGKLTAKKAGSAKITVTEDSLGLSTSIKLTVKAPAEEEQKKEAKETKEIKETKETKDTKETAKVVYDRSIFTELEKNMEIRPNTYISNLPVLKSTAETDDYMFDQLSHWTQFGILVDNLSIVRTDKEYADMFPFVSELSYIGMAKFANGYCITVDTGTSMFNSDDCSVLYALSSGNKDKLTKNGKTVYDEVEKVAKLCKGSTEYDTVKNIHDHLVKTIDYMDYEDDYHTAHSLYGALIFNKCVCDGYAKSFMALCMASGIEVKLISGDAGNEGHSWNMVRIDDEWYQIDCTWDDPVYSNPSDKDYDKVFYSYFLITDDMMKEDHSWFDTNFPKADSDKYYQLKDIEVIKDVSELKGRLKSLYKGKNQISFYTDKELSQSEFDILADNIRNEIDDAKRETIYSNAESIGRGILEYTVSW